MSKENVNEKRRKRNQRVDQREEEGIARTELRAS